MRGKPKSHQERDLYEPVRARLQQVIQTAFPEFHLEITAQGVFSNKLKSQIPQDREIVFKFLKEAAPDITGFVKKEYSTDFIVVEVKNEMLKLEDIYQARKYAELFDARYAILVSLEEIQEEIKRLSRVVYSLLSLPAGEQLVITIFNIERGFVEWFPQNPFQTH